MSEGSYIGSELELFQFATNWKKYFARLIVPFLNGNILEVGAGIGGTTKYLCNGNQSSWVCLEPDKEMAVIIQDKISRGELPACCKVRHGYTADLQGLGAYDTVVYIDVLEHINHEKDEIVAASRLLKPGGHIIALVPAYQCLYTSFDKAVGHYRRYSTGRLMSVFPAFFKKIWIKHLDSVGLCASLGNRLILKKGTPHISEIMLWDKCMVPVSRIMDYIFFYSIGRSILGVWQLISSHAD
jgi:ubiquinone/menaquinone biosynthesis C-methylase UbiE